MAYQHLDNSRLNYQRKEGEINLKEAAIRFLHDGCEGLRFVMNGKKDDNTNQEREVDRLCLEKALGRFLDSGTANDAFDVYFCYLEMFVGSYGSTKDMVEMLSEFETNGSSLLMKHRDHYSHSVYVFALGLAFYETNSIYRKKYKAFYGLETGLQAAHHFLEYWGLCALFHDIGYPFELPFEQQESYFDVRDMSRQGAPFMAYMGLGNFIAVREEEDAAFCKIYGIQKKAQYFKNTNELFAYNLAQRLGGMYHFTKESMQVLLETKPMAPNHFGYYMDHAYFSAAILYQELVRADQREKKDRMTLERLDALTAILMHNSLYKFSISFYKNKQLNRPFQIEYHPLAYMLMLCDELQCWDRVAYGRNSRRQLHPMDCEFRFSDGKVHADYIYDADEEDKVKAFEAAYKTAKADQQPKLKSYSDMVNENQFLKDIQALINTEDIGLTTAVQLRKKACIHNRKRPSLSQSNYISLYEFAVVLNARYKDGAVEEYGIVDEKCRKQMEKDFHELTLEYKLSNIRQAKAFAEHLEDIECFYTDKPVEFDLVTVFTEEELQILGELEHGRWLMEHQEMGWKFGNSYTKEPNDDERRRERERLREHELMLDGELNAERIKEHYEQLSDNEKNKDVAPMNTMLKLIKNYDGLRIYRLYNEEK
ncbi:MAG: hypothetical protein NC124_09535 [Clostridium sp.]|nr:hypothetical protein [Clostridium sp.]